MTQRMIAVKLTPLEINDLLEAMASRRAGRQETLDRMALGDAPMAPRERLAGLIERSRRLESKLVKAREP